MKKILMLGGSRYIVPVIEAAHNLGHYVITCDYLPDNIAHVYSDEYHNISILERDRVLDLAEKLDVDGIMSFATDPGVLVAAYVAEKLKLPTNPYKSTRILQDKYLFRTFLRDNDFHVPFFRSYSTKHEALKDLDILPWPVIVKPTDSAGSKGVTKVDSTEGIEVAIDLALSYSPSNKFIIEQFLFQKGYSSDCDAFSIDGKLEFISFNSQRFDLEAANPYVPSAYSWPPSMSKENQEYLTGELQRLIALLELKTSVYNIETRECVDGKAYIMEASPRGGGNRLSEMVRYSTGVDLISNSVRAAVGDAIPPLVPSVHIPYLAEVILHSNKAGKFREVMIAEKIRTQYLIQLDIWVDKGKPVNDFTGANETIGTMVLQFDSQKQLDEVMSNQNEWLKIVVE